MSIPDRYSDLSVCDEFDLFVFSLRGDVLMLEEQIQVLEKAIAEESARLRKASRDLEAHSRVRSRLLLLRSAMLRFVDELEGYDALFGRMPGRSNLNHLPEEKDGD